MAIKYPSCFRQQFVDKNGRPVASGKLEFYLAGTSIPLPAYTIDGVSLGDTVTLDIEGSAEFALDTARTYDICLYDKFDRLLNTFNSVSSSGEDGGGMQNPMSAIGDMIVGGVDGDPQSLSTTGANEGDVLKLTDDGDGNLIPHWDVDAAGMSNPMTAIGDMIVGGTDGDPQRLGIGANDQIFSVYSGSPKWRSILNGTGISLDTASNYIKISADTQTGDHKVVVDGNDTSPGYLASKITAGSNVTITNNGTAIEISSIDTGMLNPMTTAGDLIVGGASGAPNRIGIGTDGYVLTVSSGAPVWSSIPTQTGDHKIVVNNNDTNPQYLGSKLKAGAGVSIAYYNNDKMEITSQGQVKINSSGSLGYLTDKLIQGSGITLTKTNSDITIAANTQTGDHKVVVDGNDTTPGYLGSKLVQGSGITLTAGANNITIAANTQTGDHKILANSTDGTAGYLYNKIRVGTGGLSKTTYTSGSSTSVELGIDVSGSTSGQVLTSTGTGVSWANQTGDHLVIATLADSTGPSSLKGKVMSVSPIKITTDTENSVQKVKFAIDSTGATSGKVLTANGSGGVSWSAIPTQTGDHKVISAAGDPWPDYLGGKVRARAGGEIKITTESNYVFFGVSSTDQTSGKLLTSNGSGGVSWEDPAVQTGDHKVLTNSADGLSGYLSDKISVTNGLSKDSLTVGTNTRLVLGINTTGASSGQVLTYNNNDVTWNYLPTKTAWSIRRDQCSNGIARVVDRTYIVRFWGGTEGGITKPEEIVSLLYGGGAGAVYRAYVWDGLTRAMTHYGEAAADGQSLHVPLTEIGTFNPTNFWIGICMHNAGSGDPRFISGSFGSGSGSYYYDAAFNSGDALPSNQSLTTSTINTSFGLAGR